MHERIRIMGCLTTPPDAPTAQRRIVGLVSSTFDRMLKEVAVASFHVLAWGD
jgi:hypothetical protein